MNLNSIRDFIAPAVTVRGYDADALYVASGCLWYGQRVLLRASDVTPETISARLERIMREEFPPTWAARPPLTGSHENDNIICGIAIAVVLVVVFAAGWFLRGVI